MGEADTSVTGFWADKIDLASERLGGRAIVANDDFFASKDNLLKAGRAVFIPDKYTDLGKWMDGWESRRRRVPGHDWCIVALGQPGYVHGVNVDTSHFNGNQPEVCTVEGAELAGDPDGAALSDPGVRWTEIVARTLLKPSSEHLIPARMNACATRVTHVRLNIFPDGGVARLRVYGDVAADWETLRRYKGPLELSAAKYGGLVIACNDMHFGSRHNLLMPDRAANMGDGWETRRKRGLTWEAARPVEHDWAVVHLAARGTISGVTVDTTHFKGNFPESCCVEVCDAPGKSGSFDVAAARWSVLLPRTPLSADTVHSFDKELDPAALGAPCTHARLSIYPDGGVSRLRLWGRPVQ